MPDTEKKPVKIMDVNRRCPHFHWPIDKNQFSCGQYLQKVMPLHGKALRHVRIQAQSLHQAFPNATPRNIAKMILGGRDPPQVSLDSLRKVCSKAIEHFEDTGELGGDKRKGNSGAPRTVRTPGFLKKLKRSAKGKRGKSTRKLGLKFKASPRTVSRALHQDLKLKPYRRSKESRLKPHHLPLRVKSAKALRRNVGVEGKDWESVLNTDFSGKFRLVPPLNSRNDVVWDTSREGGLLRMGDGGGGRAVCTKNYSPLFV